MNSLEINDRLLINYLITKEKFKLVSCACWGLAWGCRRAAAVSVRRLERPEAPASTETGIRRGFRAPFDHLGLTGVVVLLAAAASSHVPLPVRSTIGYLATCYGRRSLPLKGFPGCTD